MALFNAWLEQERKNSHHHMRGVSIKFILKDRLFFCADFSLFVDRLNYSKHYEILLFYKGN